MTRICILAGNHNEAAMWASSQNLHFNEWFYPDDVFSLAKESNFYVIVIGTAGENVPASYFDRVYRIALERGRIGRV